MVSEAPGWSLWLVAATGLMLSVFVERHLRPRPALGRPIAAWVLHAGLWFVGEGGLILVIGRAWFATLVLLAGFLLLVMVSNAKQAALREPFVFQDWQYFTDAIRYPRLYIPFLGWFKSLVITLIISAVCVLGWISETSLAEKGAVEVQLMVPGALLMAGILLTMVGHRASLPVTLQPDLDIARLGLLSCLWHYGKRFRERPSVIPPIFITPRHQDPVTPAGPLPHLLALQSESFFDPRPCFPGIREQILSEFDSLKREAVLSGSLRVPAWGANTVRTEFAFLSGLDPDALGVHRFHPYLGVTPTWPGRTLATQLRNLGYRTVCVHPYAGSFYGRDRVLPLLGFDSFIDIQSFSHAPRAGQFIGDLVLAERITHVLESATEPLFVFAITMENHGPLHLESACPSELCSLYEHPPPPGCDELTVYLRHLRNADRMIGLFRQRLPELHRPVSLCWFGDHVPIMPRVYERFCHFPGDVEFVIWKSESIENHEKWSPRKTEGLAACQLASRWMEWVQVSRTAADSPEEQYAGQCGRAASPKLRPAS